MVGAGCDESPAPAPPDDVCRLECEAAVETCYKHVCWERFGEREAKAPDEAARRRVVEDMVACRRACAFHTGVCLSGCPRDRP